jgi:hypothetical protein
MLTKINRWTLALTAVLFGITLTMLCKPAYAAAVQTETVDSTSISSCFSCHENLYYLYDMGKSYCVTEHKERCVNCHAGNPDAMNKVQAHLGLIVHPQKDSGAICQQCHLQDADIRLATFASLGGYKTVVESEPYTPTVDAMGVFPDVPEENQLVENWPWLAGAFILLGFWLMLVFLSPQKI